MKQRIFGTTGLPIPVVGQGTWPLPDIKALQRGISLGMTHIDTAEMYGNGRSEELVGEAIRGIPRESLFLVSKVLPEHGRKADIVRSCDQSLRRMGITHFDCYLLHWRGDVDLAETMEGLEQLLHSGKTRSIGVSNLDPWDLREAVAALHDTTIACNQVLYNLAERTIEDYELPWARQHNQALVAYTPLGGVPQLGPGAAVLDSIAASRRTTRHAIALAFLLRDEHVFVIPKASTIAHVEANAQAGDIDLHPEEIARLEAAFPKKPRVGSLPTN